MIVPLEDDEQKAVVKYCRLKGLPHFRVPNETYTKSHKQKAKNKALGVSSGVPDLFVITHGRLVAIEMKRIKGSTTSANQKAWIERLNAAGVPAIVAKGAEQAIQFIENPAITPADQMAPPIIKVDLDDDIF